MKKLLALLLLSPLASSDIWAEFIETENLQLTHIVCEHSGEEVQTMVSAEIKDDVSYTDYFLFNDDYLFVRLESLGYSTEAYVTGGETYQPPTASVTVTINDETVQRTHTTNQEGLDMLSNDDRTYKNVSSSRTINRLTGTIKTSADRMYFAPSMDANGTFKSRTTGLCSLVTDKKKF